MRRRIDKRGSKNFDARERRSGQEQELVICGVHPVEEALGSLNRAQAAEATLFVASSRNPKEVQKIMGLAKKLGLSAKVAESSELDKRAVGVRHQGVILLLPPFVYADFEEILIEAENKENPLFLLLDQVQDPHNLGAIIRSAAAFGVDAIMIPKDRSALITSSSLKTSAGLAYKIPIVKIGNLAQCLKRLTKQGYHIVGADLQGKAQSGFTWQGPHALVMGSESEGLRRLTKEHCDELIRIVHEDTVESLNVSVACAILLSQAYVKRMNALSDESSF
ncbi:MAG: 23S rRNA (guanosine(2251)-2'-O)-methyltransferase RlmB [Bradymonadales bacterium]|jgi:23S rRNA (guanosine2251-2'-O)-methyltransferase